MHRLLIADDQVPDSSLSSEEEIRNYYLKLYKDSGFAEGFVFMRKLIKLARERGYEVDCVSTPPKVIDLVKKETYEVVVLDLGWYTFDKLPYDERMVLGWKLAKEIQQNSSAQILMFSNRFFEDQELARTAAEMGCLPVYKSYDEVCARNMLVTILWATLRKNLADTLTNERKIHSFRMYRRLSNVLLASIMSSVILLLATVVLVVRNAAQTTVASSIFGVVAVFFSRGIYKYVSAYQKSIR